MKHRILLIDDLVSLLRRSRSTIDRRIQEAREGRGDFPLPISLPGQQRFWNAIAIEQWLESRSRAPPLVNVAPVASEKRKASDFAERQRLAEQSLERHRRKGSQK